MTETLATFLAVTALALTSAAADTTGRQRAMLAALTGSGFALAALCRPTFLASLLLMAAGILYVLQSWRERLQTLAAMCVAASLVLLPWAARNFIDFGKPIVTTTHGGYTLLLGNNPAYYDFLHTAPWRAVWSADQLDAGLLAQRSSDEVTNDRREYELAWQTIREQPTMFLYATLRRITALWGVLPHQVTDGESSRARWGRYAVAIWYVTVFALAIAALAPGRSSVGNALRGVPSNANRRPSGSPGTPQRAFPTEAHNNACTQMNVAAVAIARPPWLWAALLIASFTAVHLLYWTDMRMRAPLVPAVSLLAAAGCKRLTALCQNTQTPVS